MPVGILDGKRILVAGVTLDSSIGFATAKVAQEQGATVLISNFGRALSITKRIAKRLPVEPPVLELDVTDAPSSSKVRGTTSRGPCMSPPTP
jgi:enoyl ACP reductase